MACGWDLAPTRVGLQRSRPNRPVSQDNSPNPVSERRSIEVEQESEPQACCAQIRNQLSVVHDIKPRRGLQFDDNARIDDEVDALAGNCDSAIVNCDWTLALEIDPARRQLET